MEAIESGLTGCMWLTMFVAGLWFWFVVGIWIWEIWK